MEVTDDNIFTVFGPGEKMVAKLKKDYTMEFVPDYNPDEAARVFWMAISKVFENHKGTASRAEMEEDNIQKGVKRIVVEIEHENGRILKRELLASDHLAIRCRMAENRDFAYVYPQPGQQSSTR